MAENQGDAFGSIIGAMGAAASEMERKAALAAFMASTAEFYFAALDAGMPESLSEQVAYSMFMYALGNQGKPQE